MSAAFSTGFPFVIACSSDQTPNHESTNPEFIPQNLLLVFIAKIVLLFNPDSYSQDWVFDLMKK